MIVHQVDGTVIPKSVEREYFIPLGDFSGNNVCWCCGSLKKTVEEAEDWMLENQAKAGYVVRVKLPFTLAKQEKEGGE